MGRKIKKGGLRDYLYSFEGLDWESKDAVAMAKLEYYKAYKNAWRKRQRHATKQLLVSLSPTEAQELADVAKKHRLSQTRFVKQACFCYLRKRYLPTEPIVLAIIRQLLGQNLIALQQLKNYDFVPADRGIQAISLMNTLERTVLDALYNPKELNI